MYLIISTKEIVTSTVYKIHTLVLELMKNLFDLVGIVTVILVLLGQMQGGVAILFAKNLEYKVHNSISDPDGNFLLLDITVYSNRFTLATIYGPNIDNPSFFQNVSEKISEFNNNSVIWCGDFNLVQNPKLDYKNYKSINNKNAREKVLEIINDQHLVDPYRDAHPELRRYTWRRKQPSQQARLDFFFSI